MASNQLTASDGTPITIRAILAMDLRGAIGYDDSLIFNNPKDLDFFRNKTLHHVCVMGRKTFESIGRILPKRQTVILTKSPDAVRKKLEHMKIPANTPVPIVGSDVTQVVIDAVDQYGDPNVYICGGASIYATYAYYTTTWLVTSYTIDVAENPELLPEGYDPRKIVYLKDRKFLRLYSSLMLNGVWNGIRYRTRGYSHPKPDRRTVEEIAEANRENEYYNYKAEKMIESLKREL